MGSALKTQAQSIMVGCTPKKCLVPPIPLLYFILIFGFGLEAGPTVPTPSMDNTLPPRETHIKGGLRRRSKARPRGR